MLEEFKEIIIANFVTLMKECNVNVLKDILVNKKVFSESELQTIFSTDDARHNKRVFFFNIQKKGRRDFSAFLEALKKTNQHKLADILSPGQHKGCHPFVSGKEPNEEDDLSLSGIVPVHENTNMTRLSLKVKPSDKFYDEVRNGVKCYSSRSKKRGRVLIINNYKYDNNTGHEYRNGAEVDNDNLKNLFTQMGGYEIEQYNNKPKEEMKMLIKLFSQNESNNQYDICFVIIMGHGSEISNRTVIYGIDGRHIFTDDVQNEFTNEKCKYYRGKPKVFLFQVCRGGELDWTVRHTEIDSVARNPDVPYPKKEVRPISTNIRTLEDILVGFATLHGYKAHRDPNLGSWYIELICKTFMENSYNTPVDDLLQIVDDYMRSRMSEIQTMQTPEYHNRGFKKLYLNPGIYYEDGNKNAF